MRKKFNKVPRKAMTVTMAIASIISLSACSSNSNSYGKISADEIYAQAGDFTVSNAELWNEFKWNAADDMKSQFTNVVLNNEINKVTLVLKNDYSSLTEDDKTLFLDEDDENHTFTKEEYDALYTKYSDRMVDYVVQDIYDLNFETGRYWKKVKELTSNLKNKCVAKYCDSLYSMYKIEEIDGTSIKDLITNASEANPDGLLTIAKRFSPTYYPMLAKEVCAEDELSKTAWDKYDEDVEENEHIEDDDYIGYFSETDIISKFKKLYANQFDLDLLMIRFDSEDEMNNTFRAFGIKPYDGKFFFIPKENATETYSDYCTRYDKITNPIADANTKNTRLSDAVVLQVLVQIYNYIYGGYRTSLSPTDVLPLNLTIEKLYDVTMTYNNAWEDAENKDELLGTIIAGLKQNNSGETHFTREELDDQFIDGMITQLYDKLDLEDSRYTGVSQKYNNSSYIVFKLDQAVDTYNLYDKDLTNDKLITDVILKEDNKDVFNKVYTELIHDKVTEDTMNTQLNSRLENVSVKIFDEATMISYSKNNEYKKSNSKAPNDNCIATIEYDDKTFNYNIKADNEDEDSIKIPGTDEAYGAFDYFCSVDGATTAIDVLSSKIIKTTKAYEKTNENRKNFEKYINTVLLSFTNGGMASYGYNSEMGVYNFMMLYFHSADVNDVIDDFYRVQYASTSLLTDYSNIDLTNFLQSYSQKYYEKYFSMSGTNVLVCFDGDDDTKEDKLETWADKLVDQDGDGVADTKLQVIAKSFIYDIYEELNASSETHATRLAEIIEEIQSSGRVKFESNPILPENKWAKYRKFGLNVKSEDFTVTNSTVDVDFAIKQRIYDYAQGEGADGTKYQYFVGQTIPTEYLQLYTGGLTQVSKPEDNQIVKTENGFNLLLVTNGTVSASAKYSKDDHNDNLLKDIVLYYNEKYVTIADVYNETDILNANQIQLYVLENAINGSTSLVPTEINEAVSAFLSPVYSRYTGSETQRVIVLYFIEQKTNSNIINSTNIFKDANVNAEFGKILEINHNTADDYSDIYGDPTGTNNMFKDWWTDLQASVSKFLLKEVENND